MSAGFAGLERTVFVSFCLHTCGRRMHCCHCQDFVQSLQHLQVLWRFVGISIVFKLILKATAEKFVFWIFHHCSKSMNSDLTADTEEIPLGTCYRDTGGTCRFFSCATSRGEASDGGVIKKDQIRSQMMARIARSYQDQEWVAILWRTDMI